MKERFNRATPTDDQTPFIGQVSQVTENLTTLAGSSAKHLTARLFPTILPYELGALAAFDFAGFNGRALTDDVMDVIPTLATNTPLGDGAVPGKNRTRDEFPYFRRTLHARRASRRYPARPGAKKRW